MAKGMATERRKVSCYFKFSGITLVFKLNSCMLRHLAKQMLKLLVPSRVDECESPLESKKFRNQTLIRGIFP